MMKHLKLFILLNFLIFSSNKIMADTVEVLSPSVNHSYAYGSVTSTYLEWEDEETTMWAYVNYSNTPYAQGEPNQDSDQLRFKIPNVTFNASSGLYSLKNSKGVMIPFAQKNLTSQLTKKITPLSSTRLTIDNMGGTFMLFITACNSGEFSNDSMPWVIRTRGFGAGNLISHETAVP